MFVILFVLQSYGKDQVYAGFQPWNANQKNPRDELSQLQ